MAETAEDRLLLLGEISGEIAHELRNALQLVSTHAHLARRDPAASGPHLAKIEKSARLAQAIVEDVLSLARGEPLRREATTLAEVLALARAQTAPKLEWEDPPADVPLDVHPLLLSRLFKVLFENAAQAGARRVTVTARGAPLVVTVEDDGPGVPPEIAGRVFAPLVSGREGGAGLGLALARRVAAAHGATLELAASRRGARFELAFAR